MTEKTAQCRYTGKFQRCPNPAVDPIGEVLLCTQHIGRVLELLKARGFTITAPAAEWCDDCKHEAHA